MNPQPTVFLVDDDPAVLAALALLVRSDGLHARTYPDAQTFLDEYHPTQPGCVVTDLRMPGMNGLDLQDRLHANGSTPPVIILTGHGDVSVAVRALKAGAVDFVEKPYEPPTLLAAIREALARDLAQRRADADGAALGRRLAALTPRERQIMTLVTDGLASKVIAIELGISERTVELHRSRVMRKMGARSLPDLVRMSQAVKQTAG